MTLRILAAMALVATLSSPSLAGPAGAGLVGNCGMVHASPGCSDSLCETCVCDDDSFCCGGDDGTWEARCVMTAADECADVCLEANRSSSASAPAASPLGLLFVAASLAAIAFRRIQLGT